MEKKGEVVLFSAQDPDKELRREVRIAEVQTARELAIKLAQLTGQAYDVEVSIRVSDKLGSSASPEPVTDQTRYEWPPDESLVVLNEPPPMAVVFEAMKLMDMPQNVRSVIQVLYVTNNEPLTAEEVAQLGRGREVFDQIKRFLREARMPFTISASRTSNVWAKAQYRLFLIKPPESS